MLYNVYFEYKLFKLILTDRTDNIDHHLVDLWRSSNEEAVGRGIRFVHFRPPSGG